MTNVFIITGTSGVVQHHLEPICRNILKTEFQIKHLEVNQVVIICTNLIYLQYLKSVMALNHSYFDYC